MSFVEQKFNSLSERKPTLHFLRVFPRTASSRFPKKGEAKDRKIEACIPRYVLCGLRQAG